MIRNTIHISEAEEMCAKIAAERDTYKARLEKLQEVVSSKEWHYASHVDHDGQLERIENILYPPETTQ